VQEPVSPAKPAAVQEPVSPAKPAAVQEPVGPPLAATAQDPRGAELVVCPWPPGLALAIAELAEQLERSRRVHEKRNVAFDSHSSGHRMWRFTAAAERADDEES
jgi:hypothetical protein